MVRPSLLIVLAACGRIGFDAEGGSVADAPSTGGARVDVYEVVLSTSPTIVSIDPIDPSRTFVTCDFRADNSSVARQPACELVDATTLRITAGIADGTTTVRPQVIQLPEGARVQRGMLDLGSNMSTAAVTIDPVSLPSSFPIISRWASLDATALDERFSFEVAFTDGQTLQVARDATGNSAHIAWQAIEYPGAKVNPGAISLSPGMAMTQAAIAQLDTTHGFVVQSSRTTSGFEAENLVRTQLTDTVIALDRIGNNVDTTVGWYTVEHPDIVVTRGVATLGVSQTFPVAAGPLDRTRTAVFLSAKGGRTNQDADLDEALVTGTIGDNELDLVRDPSSALDYGTTVSWQLVTF